MNKLSIVIVNYNSLGMIKSCLDSFEKHPPEVIYEIIIANNDDNIEDFNSFAENYREIKFIQNTGNWGFSSGCNLGASIANGEYLLFLNPDTKLNESPAIDKMVETLEHDKSIGICGCKIVDSEGEENTVPSWNNPWFFIKSIKKIHDIIYRHQNSQKFDKKKEVWYPDVISGAILMIRSNDFNKINGWNDDKYWLYSEDRDICNRISKQLNKKLAMLRNYDIYHLYGGASQGSCPLMLSMEIIISRHNYIYYNNNGFSRAIIMFFYISKSLFTPIIKLFFNILLFNNKKIAKNKFHIIKTIKYYSNSIKRKAWNSEKLKYEKR